jgi:hypothetical protein
MGLLICEYMIIASLKRGGTLGTHSLALRRDQHWPPRARKISGRKFMTPADYPGGPPRFPSSAHNHLYRGKGLRLILGSSLLIDLAKFVGDDLLSSLGTGIA